VRAKTFMYKNFNEKPHTFRKFLSFSVEIDGYVGLQKSSKLAVFIIFADENLQKSGHRAVFLLSL
jgi:hypothetical protein